MGGAMMGNRLRGYVLGMVAVLAGCAEGDTSNRPTAELIDLSMAMLAPTFQEFPTEQTVKASTFGAIGDGLTLNTRAFQEALGTGGRTVIVEPGDYVTSQLRIPSNTILILQAGVTLRDAGLLQEGQRLINIFSENVRIEGLGARVIADRSDYTTGEQRHGIFIFGARNVAITGLESSGHGGDGFYIGDYASDIVITGCLADDNRRQGLSITSASRVYVADCEFSNTRGTAPEFGIDLEPNNARDLMRDIIIVRPQTIRNNGGGILIILDKYDAGSQPATITIVDHASQRERDVLRPTGARAGRDLIRYAVTR
jgi:hypothetical protein